MYVKLNWTPIFEPCQRSECGWLDASGNVSLEDDQNVAAVWCRQCTGDLFKSLLAATLMPPVCGGGPVDFDRYDQHLMDDWSNQGNPHPRWGDAA